MSKSSKLVAHKSFGRLTNLRVGELATVRSMAIRRGIWFRALNRIERGLMNLTLKVTNKIRSKVLAKALCSIVRKLLKALESKVYFLMRQIGAPLAKKIGLIAQKWGNKFAGSWSSDIAFVRFLAIMHLNNPNVFDRDLTSKD